MRLVVCPECETQYDVTGAPGDTIPCRCGAAVRVEALRGVDAVVVRCGSCGAGVGDGARECTYCGAAIVLEGAKSLICPKCYARNDDASRYCTSCGLEFRPEPVSGTVDLVPCVHGCGTLAANVVATVPIHECGVCHSVWVPGNRLEELVARSREDAAGAAIELAPPPAPGASARVVYRPCPVCNTRMTRTNFKRISGVVVDRCPSHGHWLDADELEQLAAFARAGGLARAVAAAEEENLRLAKSAASRARIERASGHGTRARIDRELTVDASHPVIDLLRKFLR